MDHWKAERVICRNGIRDFRSFAALPTAILLIWDQEDPMWRQCLEAVSNREDPHFNSKTTLLAKYL
jgi:hypothetical protein